MKSKRILSLLMAITVTMAAFAGCAAKAPAPAATPEPAATPSAPAESAAPPAKAETTHINFFHWKGEEKETWDKIISKFQEANPDVVVDMEILPEDQYYTTLQARIMSGEGLDVFEINPGSRFNSFLKADPFMDLTDQPFMANLNPTFITSGQVDGKQYIVPMSKSFVGIFYNKAIMKELNLEVPKTWDDFLKVCEAIKKSGREVLSTGMADSYTSTWPFIEILAQYSDNLQLYHDLASGKLKFTDPLFHKVLAPLKEMADKGYIMANASGAKYDASLSMFASGKAAMLNDGTWAIGSVRQANPELDFGVMLLPVPEGNLVAGVAPAQAACVFSKTKNKDASLKFMNYIFSKECMELYGNATGQEVPHKDAVLADEDLMAIAPVGNSGDIYPHYFSEWAQIDQEIVSEITTRAMKGEDVNTILTDAQKKLESLGIKVE